MPQSRRPAVRIGPISLDGVLSLRAALFAWTAASTLLWAAVLLILRLF